MATDTLDRKQVRPTKQPEQPAEVIASEEMIANDWILRNARERNKFGVSMEMALDCARKQYQENKKAAAGK